jgi:hypothetical protein
MLSVQAAIRQLERDSINRQILIGDLLRNELRRIVAIATSQNTPRNNDIYNRFK